MNITLTGEQLGIEEDDLFCIEFDVELDDDALEDDQIQIEAVCNGSGCDVLHLVDQDYSKRFIRPMLEAIKDEKKIEDDATRRGIDL